MDLSKHITGTYGTIYYVTDMVKASGYYKDVLNLKPEEESPGWTTFSLNGHRICLHATDDARQADGKGILVANVENLDAVVAELKTRGAEFIHDVKEVCEGGYSADVMTPDGIVLSFFEYRG